MRPLRPPLVPYALLALLVTACATVPTAAPTPAAAPPPARPAFLWEVTRPEAPDRPLYLTGSIHLGRPGQFVFPPAMEAALARSQALVVELDPSRVDTQRLGKMVTALGTYPPAEGLSQHVSAETRTLLAQALTRVGLPPAGAERMRPWLLYLTLSALELHHVGYSEEGGIDRLSMGKAHGTHRLVELETIEEQLHALADLPDAVQELLLREQLEQAPGTEELLEKMSAAWERGDPEALAALLFTRVEDPAHRPFYEALFFARNRRMADRLVELLAQPDTHFVVVGAGHLVGGEGLLDLLAKRGLRVRQLPREP